MNAMETYVRDLADRMGLRDWTLRVDLGEPDAPDRRDEQRWGASAHPLPGRKYAIITLGESVLDADPVDRRETIVHELVHLHFGALVDQIRNDLDDHIAPAAFGVFDASATRNLEYGIDAVAVVIAEHMPLPPAEEAEAITAADPRRNQTPTEEAQLSDTYPHQDGDVTVLGPEIFASADGAVICWKGENYVVQDEVERLRTELAASKRYGETTYGVECRLREQREELYAEVERLTGTLSVIVAAPEHARMYAEAALAARRNEASP